MTPAGADYWELRLRCHPDASEAVANYLWEAGALGVVEETSPDQLRAFFPPAPPAEAIRDGLVAYLESLHELGLPAAPGPVELHRLADGAWGEAWKAHFRPFRLGPFWISPPWERPRLEAGEYLIQIHPGRAFGTGQHETTRLCLLLLSALVASAPLPRALDVGTGTGILAIAAARLGLPECLAIDVDPDAVASARESVRLNQVGHCVRVALASPEDLDRPPFSLILANLLTRTHQALLPSYGRLLVPGGQAILGGILATEGDQMAAALDACGFGIVGRITGEEWCALRAGRR